MPAGKRRHVLRRGGKFPRILNQWYARDAACQYRPGRPRGFVWMPSVYPEYLTDLNLTVCPSASNAGDLAESFECPGDAWCQNDCTSDQNFGRLDVAKVGNAEPVSFTDLWLTSKPALYSFQVC